MEQVIINPMWIYLIGVVEQLDMALDMVLCLAVILLIILFVGVCVLIEDTYGEERKKYEKAFKDLFKFVFIWFVFGIISVLIPSKTTLISMLVAKTVTVEKVVQGKEVVKGSIDYIFEKIQEVNNENKN